MTQQKDGRKSKRNVEAVERKQKKEEKKKERKKERKKNFTVNIRAIRSDNVCY